MDYDYELYFHSKCCVSIWWIIQTGLFCKYWQLVFQKMAIFLASKFLQKSCQFFGKQWFSAMFTKFGTIWQSCWRLPIPTSANTNQEVKCCFELLSTVRSWRLQAVGIVLHVNTFGRCVSNQTDYPTRWSTAVCSLICSSKKKNCQENSKCYWKALFCSIKRNQWRGFKILTSFLFLYGSMTCTCYAMKSHLSAGEQSVRNANENPNTGLRKPVRTWWSLQLFVVSKK